MSKIRVLLVDDSSFMRVVLSDIVNGQEDITVIDTATDGKEAVEKTKSLKPDVVLLDLTMKDYDGLYAIRNIMADIPTPIVILSSVRSTNAVAAIEALEAGAYDFLDKPAGIINSKIREIEDQICNKIRQASKIDVKNLKIIKKSNNHLHTFDSLNTYDVITIGASTGGTGAIEHILMNLPSNLPLPVLIAQHMPPEFVHSFAIRLNNIVPLQVKVATEGEIIRANTVYLMPGNANVRVKRTASNVKFQFTDAVYKEYNNPSVDCLFESVEVAYGKKIIAIILTGMGKDGTNGITRIKHSGGYTIAQDQSSSIVWGMPRSAIENGAINQVVSLIEIPGFIVSCMS